jgi:hypothetical protein
VAALAETEVYFPVLRTAEALVDTVVATQLVASANHAGKTILMKPSVVIVGLWLEESAEWRDLAETVQKLESHLPPMVQTALMVVAPVEAVEAVLPDSLANIMLAMEVMVLLDPAAPEVAAVLATEAVVPVDCSVLVLMEGSRQPQILAQVVEELLVPKQPEKAVAGLVCYC